MKENILYPWCLYANEAWHEILDNSTASLKYWGGSFIHRVIVIIMETDNKNKHCISRKSLKALTLCTYTLTSTSQQNCATEYVCVYFINAINAEVNSKSHHREST